MSKKDIRFIRKNGRIIPIKLTREQKGQLKGAAIATGGAAVSVGGGSLYRKAVVGSSSLAMGAFRKLESAFSTMGPAQMNFGDLSRRAKMQKNADTMFRASARLAKGAKAARGISTVLGAGMMSYGVMKAVTNMNPDKRRKISPELAAGGSAALAFVVPPAFQYSKRAFEAGMMNQQTTMNFAKETFRVHSPKFKAFASKLIFRR